MYESGGKLVEGTGRTELTDVICPMYPPVQLTEELCTTADVKPGSVNDRPVILCEYSYTNFALIITSFQTIFISPMIKNGCALE